MCSPPILCKYFNSGKEREFNHQNETTQAGIIFWVFRISFSVINSLVSNSDLYILKPPMLISPVTKCHCFYLILLTSHIFAVARLSKLPVTSKQFFTLFCFNWWFFKWWKAVYALLVMPWIDFQNFSWAKDFYISSNCIYIIVFHSSHGNFCCLLPVTVVLPHSESSNRQLALL